MSCPLIYRHWSFADAASVRDPLCIPTKSRKHPSVAPLHTQHHISGSANELLAQPPPLSPGQHASGAGTALLCRPLTFGFLPERISSGGFAHCCSPSTRTHPWGRSCRAPSCPTLCRQGPGQCISEAGLREGSQATSALMQEQCTLPPRCKAKTSSEKS